MANILILGAGSIGTAFSFPCSDKNNSVTIIGTHLENNFIDQINSKRIHPVLKCDVPKNVQFLKFNKLSETINKKADLIHSSTVRLEVFDSSNSSCKLICNTFSINSTTPRPP